MTPKDMNDGDDSISEFHAVYMDPESFAHYEKTGKFRDGTVLVKEFSGVGSKEAISGKGYFMGEFTGLEVSIKDSKRFKDEPGNWAYFNFGTQVPAQGGGAQGGCRLVQRVPSGQRQDGLGLQPVLPRPARRPRARSDADRGAPQAVVDLKVRHAENGPGR